MPIETAARIHKNPVVHGKPTYPADHKAAMRVPFGGSSCVTCVYVNKSGTHCSNKHFIKWHGSAKLPYPAEEYCSDWYEPRPSALGDARGKGE